MESDRIENIDRRTRLGYIALSEDEEIYVRQTMLKMNQSGFNVGRNVGGRFARLAILLLCDIYNSGKFAKISTVKDEEALRQYLHDVLTIN